MPRKLIARKNMNIRLRIPLLITQQADAREHVDAGSAGMNSRERDTKRSENNYQYMAGSRTNN
jgi:hypothetical protein